ncbi:hypothetical protein JCM19046_2356 [Bacillus sp. JCM 19046]|uniref:Catechol 2,3-dioxygenase-like lactoylglutathione lyase family enzyme n=1 Tax=Shouchella xiaoxiensis TaxID=766895 RepID=A0ABS2SWW9_9BACI|nr:VOC family protein [Shouchella xiaoxiensis]MBM7840025.1 catechol 2,3-dioxygenase-like lactoylglutathione lyase family enzyme [Shouchella xiaoxiensis]GAF12613.1 hypothetical protein JCM19045_1821 [Bacillus sp. JCM 19045]GAF17827.1 hypothetical protein JCM19046_2356 [Bacillus sp. JCM 19046]
MKLVFLYHPVKNLKESLRHYREVLGFEEAWREGDHTAALKMNTDVQLLIEEDEQDLAAGGVFLVDSVDDFYKENHMKFEFIKKPKSIPPGRYAVCKDWNGNFIRLIDFTNENE